MDAAFFAGQVDAFQVLQAFPSGREVVSVAGYRGEGEDVGQANIQADGSAQAPCEVAALCRLAEGTEGFCLAFEPADAGRELHKKAFLQGIAGFGEGGAVAIAFEVEQIDVGIEEEAEPLLPELVIRAISSQERLVGPSEIELRQQVDAECAKWDPIIKADGPVVAAELLIRSYRWPIGRVVEALAACQTNLCRQRSGQAYAECE